MPKSPGHGGLAYPAVGSSRVATYLDGRLDIEGTIDWPDGTKVLVSPIPADALDGRLQGHVIVAGFGLAGRCVVDLLAGLHIPFTIIEQNAVTVETQRALGRQIVHGDAANSEVLIAAGLHTAGMLALTIPDEEAVLQAIALARRLHPDIYIIARTNYSSKGMHAAQLGADDVVKAEQAVALQFYERLSRRLGLQATETC